MRKTLIATAILLGIGLTLPAMADDDNSTNSHNNSSTHTRTNSSQGNDRNNVGDANASAVGAASANNGGTATSAVTNSFNNSKAVAVSRLDGTVTDIQVSGIGNVAQNWGNANGARGGKATGWCSG